MRKAHKNLTVTSGPHVCVHRLTKGLAFELCCFLKQMFSALTTEATHHIPVSWAFVVSPPFRTEVHTQPWSREMSMVAEEPGGLYQEVPRQQASAEREMPSGPRLHQNCSCQHQHPVTTGVGKEKQTRTPGQDRCARGGGLGAPWAAGWLGFGWWM